MSVRLPQTITDNAASLSSRYRHKGPALLPAGVSEQTAKAIQLVTQAYTVSLSVNGGNSGGRKRVVTTP